MNAPYAQGHVMVVHTCACKRTFTQVAWDALPYVGEMGDEVGERIELRNCPCGSTRAVEIPMSDRQSSHFVRAVQYRVKHQGMTLEAAVRDFIKHNPTTALMVAEELGSWPASDPEMAMFQKVYR